MYQYFKQTRFLLISYYVIGLIINRVFIEISIAIRKMPFWQLPIFWFYSLMSNWHKEEVERQNAIRNYKYPQKLNKLP